MFHVYKQCLENCFYVLYREFYTEWRLCYHMRYQALKYTYNYIFLEMDYLNLPKLLLAYLVQRALFY